MTKGRVTESNGCGLRRHIQYERDVDESPSIAAAMALAQYFDDDITATSTRLYDYIDPDALDSLFDDTNHGDRRPTGTIEFEVDDALVTIRPDRIDVCPTT